MSYATMILQSSCRNSVNGNIFFIFFFCEKNGSILFIFLFINMSTTIELSQKRSENIRNQPRQNGRIVRSSDKEPLSEDMAKKVEFTNRKGRINRVADKIEKEILGAHSEQDAEQLITIISDVLHHLDLFTTKNGDKYGNLDNETMQGHFKLFKQAEKSRIEREMRQARRARAGPRIRVIEMDGQSSSFRGSMSGGRGSMSSDGVFATPNGVIR